MVEIVAEFTTNHMGHLGLLCRMVDEAAQAGASSIKMQRKSVESFYSQEKLNRDYQSPFGRTYRDYRTLFELCPADWERFSDRCDMHQTPWFQTAQDEASLNEVMRHGKRTTSMHRIKVASSNARDLHFLEMVARGVPRDWEVVVSVGGSTLQQVEQVVKVFGDHRRLWLLHCVAEYPCPAERLRLGNIPVLRKHFAGAGVRIGYSGHEEGIAPSVAAVNLGAEMVERHFCISRHSFVHHIECSLEPDEFAELVRLAQGDDEPREAACRDMPVEAYESQFGMSGAEREFLVEQKYGCQLMGGKSVI